MTDVSMIIEDGNEVLIPLNIPVGVEEIDVINSLFDQVLGYAGLMREG